MGVARVLFTLLCLYTVSALTKGDAKLGFNIDPVAPAFVKQPLNVYAELLGSGPIPSGNITLSINNVPFATSPLVIRAGYSNVLFQPAISAIGVWNLQYTYSGDANWNSGTSIVLTQTVVKGTPTLQVNAKLPASISVTVPGVCCGVIPTGQVGLYANDVLVGSLVNVNQYGQATWNAPVLPPGQLNLVVRYLGDTAFNQAAYPAIPYFVKGDAKLGFNIDPVATSVVKQPLNVYAELLGSGPIPSGNITLSIDNVPFATSPLVIKAGFSNVLFQPAISTVGVHSLQYTYSGDANWKSGTSVVLTQTVVKATQKLQVTLNPPSTSTAEQPVTIYASIPGANGQVGLYVNDDLVGSLVNLNQNGVATWSVTTLPAGQLNLVIRYLGDDANNAVDSLAIPFTVNAISVPAPAPASSPLPPPPPPADAPVPPPADVPSSYASSYGSYNQFVEDTNGLVGQFGDDGKSKKSKKK